jgi:N-ethylmaleimide reductase
MAAGDLTVGLANQALDKGLADLFAFGRGFVGNPDLPERMRIGAPLTPPDMGSFYGGGAKGLTDWPVYAPA